MARLLWGNPADRNYESGVDRGVLFVEDNSGVAWTGLISVDESSIGGEISSYYFDGIKYLDLLASKDFSATIRAFSAPPEFGPCVGDVSLIPGFVITRQPKKRFSLCYRTRVNEGQDYRLHFVYNVLATPDKKSYQTRGDSPSPTQLAWNVDAVPVPSTTYRPTAHFTVDSRKTNRLTLSSLEDLIYGTEYEASTLPTPLTLIQLFSN